MKRTLLILLGVLLLTGIMLNGQFVSAGNTIMRMLTGKEQAMLSFHSFDGGGPQYSIELDSDIVSYESKKEYDKPDHKRMRGAGYDVIFTFTGLKAGETVVTVKKRSPIHERENEDRKYKLKVDKDLNVTIEPIKPAPK
jgi:hypothetical protein